MAHKLTARQLRMQEIARLIILLRKIGKSHSGLYRMAMREFSIAYAGDAHA